MADLPSHFKGKDAIGHVVEAQAKGIISASEIHGTEIPGHISATADAARDTSILFLLLLPFFLHFQGGEELSSHLFFLLLGWTAWKMGRASWLGWSRLERLHRVLEQEKWEIEHNRGQERAELKELYRAKGFEGKLLEDVLDVLMSDSDRLLRVMVEEELGLTLEKMEHPLKQGIGAGLGAFLAGLVILFAFNLLGPIGLIVFSLLFVALSAAVLAYFVRNKIIPAVVWNLSLALLAFGITYYTIQILT